MSDTKQKKIDDKVLGYLLRAKEVLKGFYAWREAGLPLDQLPIVAQMIQKEELDGVENFELPGQEEE